MTITRTRRTGLTSDLIQAGTLLAVSAILAVMVAAFTGGNAEPAAAAAVPTYCTTFNERLANNLHRLGHDLAYGSTVWAVDGQVVGNAPAEDVDFRACGTGRTARPLRTADTLRCGVMVDEVVVENLRAAGHEARFVWDEFDGGWWHIDGVRVVSTDGPDVLATGCAPTTLATAIEQAQP